MQASMKILQRAESGQGVIEYGLILVLVAVVVLVVLIATGGQSKALYSDITSTMQASGL
jgi:pilus assembly protein Flp/PilA